MYLNIWKLEDTKNWHDFSKTLMTKKIYFQKQTTDRKIINCQQVDIHSIGTVVPTRHHSTVKPVPPILSLLEYPFNIMIWLPSLLHVSGFPFLYTLYYLQFFLLLTGKHKEIKSHIEKYSKGNTDELDNELSRLNKVEDAARGVIRTVIRSFTRTDLSDDLELPSK